MTLCVIEQLQLWGVCFSGMWYCVTECLVPDISSFIVAFWPLKTDHYVARRMDTSSILLQKLQNSHWWHSLYLCCCGATYVPCVDWLYRPIVYVFCQTEFDCPNLSVNLFLGLYGSCPLHGISVVLKFEILMAVIFKMVFWDVAL